MARIANFGRNVRFEPAEILAPKTEAELLDILRRSGKGKIRVVASRHSWSDLIVTHDTLISMRHFREVEVLQHAEGARVRVGGGCQIKHLLAELAKQGLTLPSVGLITEQTIAGATATGTHGSGRHSLSHYLESVRIACYQGPEGSAAIVDVTEGDDLRAARCSLGCLGVVVSVTLPCVPQYRVQERAASFDTIEQALDREAAAPLQQFFLFPHKWNYFVQERCVVEGPRSRSATLYRIYWFLALDIGVHLFVKLFAAWLRSRRLVQFLYRHLLPRFIFPRWVVVDRSDRTLVMEHELFRHLELEAFVPDRRVADAARFVEIVLKQADGAEVDLPEETRRSLEAASLLEEFKSVRGRFTHHYPVCFRRVLRDDTLISMASGQDAAWYAISFITYREPREAFYQMADFLARALAALFEGRIHWGKWFPLQRTVVERMYPRLDDFRAVCLRFDPESVFQNEFTGRILNLPGPPVPPSRC